MVIKVDIDMIEVRENDINFIIFPKKEQVLIDNNYYPITEKEIGDFVRIIRIWDNQYMDNSYFDGNRFNVNVYYDGKVDKMSGIRGIPSNYEAFTKFVRSIYDRR